MKMRKGVAVAIVIVAICSATFAAQKSLEQLKAEVASASDKDKPKLYVQIADLELKQASAAFDAGDSAQAQAAVSQVASDCENAGKSSISTRKRLKETEIALRKIGERLDEMRRNVSFDDRAPLAQAIDRVQAMRADLLNAMFSK